jgi:hypothetical protein
LDTSDRKRRDLGALIEPTRAGLANLPCGPFGDYSADSQSVFMEKALNQ